METRTITTRQIIMILALTLLGMLALALPTGYFLDRRAERIRNSRNEEFRAALLTYQRTTEARTRTLNLDPGKGMDALMKQLGVAGYGIQGDSMNEQVVGWFCGLRTGKDAIHGEVTFQDCAVMASFFSGDRAHPVVSLSLKKWFHGTVFNVRLTDERLKDIIGKKHPDWRADFATLPGGVIIKSEHFSSHSF